MRNGRKVRSAAVAAVVAVLAWASGTPAQALARGAEAVLLLAPGPGNPRNSEGDFVTLKDGRILFVYSRFTGGAGDHAAADLVARESRDSGRTWSAEDRVVVPNEGAMNVMSVSLLRLAGGDIALLYLRKNGEDDCMPFLRVSRDEAASWGEPTAVGSTVGYHVVNNDRLVQLAGGRLLIPAARHNLEGEQFNYRASAFCYLSDDGGATWREGGTIAPPEGAGRTGLQEPGVIALRDGRLWLWARTAAGVQYQAFSGDDGETWSVAEPSRIASPVSPASMERIPATGDLLLLWNNHGDVPPGQHGKRTPLTAGISRDDGATWRCLQNIETDPDGWYCYTAIHFVDDAVLLGYCAGDRTKDTTGLGRTRVVRVPVAWLYTEAGDSGSEPK